MSRILLSFSSGLICLVVAACMSDGYADNQRGLNSDAFEIKATDVSARRVQPGQSVGFSAEIASPIGAADVIVHLQVFDEDNVSVAKRSWEGQTFGKGQSLSYTLDWPVPARQYGGDYVGSIGIFDADWSMITWFDQQAKIAVVEPVALSTSTNEPLSASSLTLGKSLLGQLPSHMGLGAKADRRGDLEWMDETGAPFDYRYGYLAGGVNTGTSWAEWSSPPGDYAYRFMTSSRERGYMPVLTYYQIVQSAPNNGQEPPYNNLLDPSTMQAYFEDWLLLMETAAEFGEPVIVHHEPDLWGYLQRKGDDPASARVAVGSSGVPEVAGMEDNARGLAQALVKFRNERAPNVILAWHATQWATGPDLTVQNADGIAMGKRVATYFEKLQAPFDLIFYGPSDRDAAWRQARKKQDAWWDDDDHARFFGFMKTINEATGLRGMVWQIPLGNTRYRSLDNTPGHFQDNHVEYFLLPENQQNIVDHAGIGIIGLLFGGGAREQTSFRDVAEDGITNPAPINGNDLEAEYPDDDGGFFRLSVKSFYDSGPLDLP